MKRLILLSLLVGIFILIILNGTALLVTPIAVLSKEVQISYWGGAYYFGLGCIFEAGLLIIADKITDNL